MARRRTTVNGRHGLPEEIKHLQDVRLMNCEQPRGLRSREIESQKVGQKKEDRIEDINAAAVVYMPITPNRDFQRQICLRCQRKEQEQERGEESAEALHRNGAGWSSGTPTGLWATKIEGFSLLTLHDEREAMRQTKWAMLWKYTANTVAGNGGQGRPPCAQRGVSAGVCVCVRALAGRGRWRWRSMDCGRTI